jgi:two-component system chemotaxis response regulator CheB
VTEPGTVGGAEVSPAPRAVVVIGASAGGIPALCEVAAELPGDLPAAVCVVLHLPEGGVSALPGILGRCGPLPAAPAVADEPLREGLIYVAPPNHHLLVDGERVRLDSGPRQNRVRPSIDVLFRSAAETCGAAVVGVILSGMLDDGTAGVIEVLRYGGTAIVQDPGSATFSGMPQSAAAFVDTASIVPLEKIARLLEQRVHTIVDDPPTSRAPTPAAHETVRLQCPDCGGSLEEATHLPQPHYRCMVGHEFSPATLLDAMDDDLERSLWHAVYVLEERSELLGRLADRVQPRTQSFAARYRRDASTARTHADRLRRVFEAVQEGQAIGGD